MFQKKLNSLPITATAFSLLPSLKIISRDPLPYAGHLQEVQLLQAVQLQESLQVQVLLMKILHLTSYQKLSLYCDESPTEEDEV